MPEEAIAMRAVEFGFTAGRPVLSIPQFDVMRGERVFLRGPSGSGKTTLLGLIGGVLEPQAGTIRVLGQDLGSLGRSGRDRFRADYVGYIFQMFNLIPYLSVLDNVVLPARFSRRRLEQAGGRNALAAQAHRLLAALGLDTQEIPVRSVVALSHGQQQRVAAARALFGGPGLVIADEPTSALDADLRLSFIDLLMHECASTGATLLFVSHDTSLAARFDRTVEIDDLNRVARSEVAAA
jgi:putative ABC transport system ATP-binding protein